MNKEPNTQPMQTAQNIATGQSTAEDQNADTSSRRELIQRYAKYALVAGPMLLFVSKAHAIHSAP